MRTAQSKALTSKSVPVPRDAMMMMASKDQRGDVRPVIGVSRSAWCWCRMWSMPLLSPARRCWGRRGVAGCRQLGLVRFRDVDRHAGGAWFRQARDRRRFDNHNEVARARGSVSGRSSVWLSGAGSKLADASWRMDRQRRRIEMPGRHEPRRDSVRCTEGNACSRTSVSGQFSGGPAFAACLEEPRAASGATHAGAAATIFTARGVMTSEHQF